MQAHLGFRAAALLGAVLGLAARCPAAWAVDFDRQVNFVIAEQSLASALVDFSRQANLQVMSPDKALGEQKAEALYGRYSIRDALVALLKGTRFAYSSAGPNTVAIVQVNASSAQEGGAAGERANVRLARAGEEAAAATPNPNGQDRALAEGARELKIEEVIVTARKRSENVQDVPMSIGVLTADDIDRRGLVGAADYLRGIPGVNQFDGGFGQSIIVRGIETQMFSQNYQSGATTATYFGETPTTDSAGLTATNVDIKLVDIERVEVLRGPQGTSFGSSSMGGAVRTIPVAPKLDRFEGKLGSNYSVTSGTGGSNYMVQGIANVPLIRDKLAIRAVAYGFTESGIYRNRAGSDPAFQATVAIPYGVQAFATDEDEVGSYAVTGGRIAALWQASDHLRVTLSYLSQRTETDGYAVATSGPYEQTILRVAPEHAQRGRNEPIFDTRIDIANVVMELDLSWADVLATYSYLEGGSTFAFPWTALNTNNPYPVSYLGPADHREHVAEVRLSTRLEGAWNFLGGIYSEKQDDEYGPLNYAWYGDPARNFFRAGERYLGDYHELREMRQQAVFGEASWEFAQGLTLTGGLRAYEYERSIYTGMGGPLFRGTSSTFVESDASGATFRANLSYKPNERALVFANWAQGFRIGKPQAPVSPALCDGDADGIIDGTSTSIESTRLLESDSVDSYEIGAKFAAFGRRLTVDAAVFRMDWSDIPVLVRPPCLTSYLANAGAARSDGVEFQANYQVSENVRIDLGGSWLRARLTQDVPAQGFTAGSRLPGTPKINANLGVQYAFQIAGRPASVRADAIHIGAFYGEMLEHSATRAGDYVKLDASARMAIDKLTIDLFIRNLTNEDAFTFHGYLPKSEFYGYRLRPRTIGFQLGYSF